MSILGKMLSTVGVRMSLSSKGVKLTHTDPSAIDYVKVEIEENGEVTHTYTLEDGGQETFRIAEGARIILSRGEG